MYHHNNYIVSFIPGARGRLIANIVYKLANNESTNIIFTEHNSAHTSIDDWDMHYIYDINQVYTKPNKKPVFFTHLYPHWDTSTIGTIFINVKRENLYEICLNAVIKNVISKIEVVKSGGLLDATEKKFMKIYAKFLPSNYTDVLYNPDKLKEFLLSIKKMLVPNVELHYHELIDTIPIDNNLFQIDYEKMFSKENGKYVTLNQLTKWMKLDYSYEIHDIFEKYDLDKYKIFERYCPWVKGEIKW